VAARSTKALVRASGGLYQPPKCFRNWYGRGEIQVEKLSFEYSGGHRAFLEHRPVLVGVVGSGNLEVLIEPAPLQGRCLVEVKTAASGFGDVWRAVMRDFFDRHELRDARIAINDVGATPAVVSLRLDQAVVELQRDGSRK
jgi:malonate decarboxylase delta subunit